VPVSKSKIGVPTLPSRDQPPQDPLPPKDPFWKRAILFGVSATAGGTIGALAAEGIHYLILYLIGHWPPF